MISKTQFEQLLQGYATKLQGEMAEPLPALPIISEKYRTSLEEAIAFLEQNRQGELLNLALMASGDENTQQEQQKTIQLLYRFLDAVIQTKEESVRFHVNAAFGVKSMLIDSTFPFSDFVYLYDDPQALSIREKYIRGNLTSRHWLTELDLQRMGQLCGVPSTIKIMPFTPENIGAALHLLQLDNEEASAKYTIPFLLSKSSADENRGVHWLAAKITVDPTRRSIQYQIDDYAQLSEAAKVSYRKIIEEAIRFDNGFYQAFPESKGWTIDVEGSVVIGHDSQKEDSYASGYLALHNLLQDPDIREDHKIATAYAQVASNASEELVKTFYKHQLEDFRIPREIYNALGVKTATRFKRPLVSSAPTVVVDESKLTIFLDDIPSNYTTPASNDGENPTVIDFVKSYTPALSLMRFPSGAKNSSLEAVHYENLFYQLSWIKGLSAHPLPRLVLAQVDNSVLDGLNAFYANNQLKLFEELKVDINLSDGEEIDAFIAKLKFALTNLSRSNLSRLILADEKGVLTQEHFSDLHAFIKANQIAVLIDIPELFSNSPIQRQLDEIYEVNQRLKNSKLLTEKNTPQSAEKRSDAAPAIRRRERLDLRHAMKIDIELQEGIEEDVVVEAFVPKKHATSDYGEINVLRLEQLQDAVHTDDFTVFQGIAHGLSKAALIAQWHTIFGNIVQGTAQQRLLENKELSGISTSALAKICEFRDHFAEGINIRQLPTGFLLACDPKNSNAQVLHYDANAEPKSTLSPLLTARPARQPLSMDLIDRIFASKPAVSRGNNNNIESRSDLQQNALLSHLWQTLKTAESYSRETTLWFRQYLPELMILDKDQLTDIIALCQDGDLFNFSKLKFIFEHLKEAQASYIQPYDETQLVDFSWMEKVFSSPETRERFVTLAHSIQPKPILEHPLLALLATESPALLKQLNQVKGMQAPYPLTDTELNELLAIYDRYAVPGVEKVLKTWQAIDALPNLHASQLPCLFKNVASYETIMFHENILLDAAKIINGLAPIQRQWWEKLYQAHQPTDDSLADLVQSFKNFVKAVEAKGLTFYSLEHIADPFPHANNLPMALGRMLSILQLCEARDQITQWKAIAQIDLSAQGALRALTEGRGGPRPCGFVIPEMAIDPKTTISDEVYDTARQYKKIATAGNRRLQLFYRFIAHQKHRLPLSFYQEAVKELEQLRSNKELPSSTVNQLYALLVETTTGGNYRHFIKDLDETKAQWQSIVDNIKHIKLPAMTDKAKEAATELLMDLNRLPALPILATLIQLITKPLQNVGVFDLSSLPKKLKRFEKSNSALNHFVEAYGSKIYFGMKFYSDEDFSRKFPVDSTEKTRNFPEGRDLFEEHLAVSHALDREEIAKELLPLVSTFRLNTSHIGEVAIAINTVKDSNSLNSIALDYALELFEDVENAEGLDCQVLLTFLNDFSSIVTTELKPFFDRCNELENILRSNESTEVDMRELFALKYVLDTRNSEDFQYNEDTQTLSSKLINLSRISIQKEIENRFKDNFSPIYFEALKLGKAQGDIAKRIDEVFKTSELRNAFEPIRLRFHAGKPDEINALFNSLQTILNQLDSSHEKLQLLEKLNDERILTVTINEYNQLLTAIAENGSSGFIHFMEIAERFPTQDIEELAYKASYFISEALPRLRKDLKQLVEMDVIALVDDLLLAEKGGKIKHFFSSIDPDLTHDYQSVIQALSQSPADPEVIEQVLKEKEATRPILSTLKTIIDLKEQISQLKIPETKTVNVTKTRTVIVPGNTLRNLFSTLTFGLVESAPETRLETYQENEIQTVDKVLESSVIQNALLDIRKLVEESTTYTFALSQTFGLIEDLVNHYPTAKPQLLPLTRSFLSFRPKEAEAGASQISIAFKHLSLLHREFLALDNQDLIISLCEHFGAKDSVYNFETLLAILQGQALTISEEGAESLAYDYKHYQDLKPRAKKQILLVVSSLLNNEKPCSLKDIEDLINHCYDADFGKDYLTVLETVFKSAPFPTLDKMEQWLTEARNQEEKTIPAYVSTQYKTWSKEPVAREQFNSVGERVNGFDLEYAKQQCQLLYGVTYTDEELLALDEKIKVAQQLDTEELLHQINEIKSSTQVDLSTLVASMAELLYRTKGLPQLGVGDTREWGRSFEINTTQYLAIHSMLKVGGHVTNQIGTGEGKSRIMMLSIACQYALGRTVDFVTADVSLATRDYLEYQAFFKALGAQTNFIMANTPASEYRIGGINFSDASNLSLFRNKAYSEGNGELVIAKAPQSRALMLDEADKTYFDAADTRFNYSAQADPTVRDMPWIYELMIAFFSIPEHRDLYDGETSDADRCNEAFRDFARGKLDEEQMKRLEAVSVKQLEAWESSALTALALAFQEDFTIRGDRTILTKYGPKQVSQAQLISGGRASENAKFSFGVHQCLHARLNQERIIAKSLPPVSLTPLQQRLVEEEFRYPFSIDSENQIVYSSTSKSLLDDYSQGELLAVTGTAGSIQEREEAKTTYGSKISEMTFIDIPRHRGQKRTDLPVLLARNEAAQGRNILSAVREAILRNQPLLLVCENDDESQKLYEFLEKHLNDAEKTELKRISADTTLAQEASHVKNTAGKSGAITVTTSMLGRGTDIRLHGEAKNYGLSVITTYLPRERDYFQIIGRSGRFGAKGDSRLILDTGALKASFGLELLPSEFYTATESYLKHQQARMDAFAQRQRVIKDAVGDFRLALTQQFFNEFYTPVYQKGNDKDTLLQSWRTFFDKTDKAWNDLWPKLSEALATEPVEKENIDGFLSQYRDLVQEEWKALREYLQMQITAGKITCDMGESTVEECLRKEVGQIKLDQKADALIYNNHHLPHYRTVIAEHYDKAFVGRAVLYRDFGERVRSFFSNIAAAWRGEGLWFPNLQAVRNGHISWSQFFFGARGKPLSEPQDLTQTKPEIGRTAASFESSTRLIQSSLDSNLQVLPSSPEADLTTAVAPISKEEARRSRDNSALFSPKEHSKLATINSKEKLTYPPASENNSSQGSRNAP